MRHLLECAELLSQRLHHPRSLVGVESLDQELGDLAHHVPSAVPNLMAGGQLAVGAEVIEEGIEVALVDGPVEHAER
eukprot:5507161-Alexandrium_andersonii.AAC.1